MIVQKKPVLICNSTLFYYADKTVDIEVLDDADGGWVVSTRAKLDTPRANQSTAAWQGTCPPKER